MLRGTASLSLSLLFLIACSAFGFQLPLQARNILDKLKLNKALENGVHRMGVELEDRVRIPTFKLSKLSPKLTAISAFLMKELEPHSHKSTKVKGNKQPRLGSFAYSSCGPKDQPMDVISLDLSPDPLYFPGDLKVGFDVKFLETIANSKGLNAKVYLDVNTGGKWINIPCLGSIGSCAYKNLCDVLSQIEQCPPEFKSAGVPCQCPFQKGEYKLPSMEVEVDASVFLPGAYRGNVTLANEGGTVACYQVKFIIG